MTEYHKYLKSWTNERGITSFLGSDKSAFQQDWKDSKRGGVRFGELESMGGDDINRAGEAFKKSKPKISAAEAVFTNPDLLKEIGAFTNPNDNAIKELYELARNQKIAIVGLGLNGYRKIVVRRGYRDDFLKKYGEEDQFATPTVLANIEWLQWVNNVFGMNRKHLHKEELETIEKKYNTKVTLERPIMVSLKKITPAQAWKEVVKSMGEYDGYSWVKGKEGKEWYSNIGDGGEDNFVDYDEALRQSLDDTGYNTRGYKASTILPDYWWDKFSEKVKLKYIKLNSKGKISQ